jgi:hypothetical protein
MKKSELKQIIKEEIVKELGFDYPNKPKDTPSQYQNGIMDTIAVIQQLGYDIDVQAVINALFPDENNVHESR